jgi:hypothetical protein
MESTKNEDAKKTRKIENNEWEWEECTT